MGSSSAQYRPLSNSRRSSPTGSPKSSPITTSSAFPSSTTNWKNKDNNSKLRSFLRIFFIISLIAFAGYRYFSYSPASLIPNVVSKGSASSSGINSDHNLRSGAPIPKQDMNNIENSGTEDVENDARSSGDLVLDLGLGSGEVVENTGKQALDGLQPIEYWKERLVGKQYGGRAPAGQALSFDAGVIYEQQLPESHRIVHPDSFLTMDFKVDRLNVHVDENNTISRVKYG